MMDFEEFRQRLFLQICDKKDLDLKGENLKNYKTNFDCAFTRAHNIALYYFDTVDKVDGVKKTVGQLPPSKGGGLPQSH